jgi:hypothetical protein
MMKRVALQVNNWLFCHLVEKNKMADINEEIGHVFCGSPSVTLSKTFSLTISGSEWFPSRKTIRELNI